MNTPRSLALAAIAAAATTVMSVLPPGTHASPPAVVVAATFDGGRSSAGVLGAVVTTPDDAPVEVTVSCGAMACPDDSSITWWVDGTQVQADVDGVVRLRPSWAGVHHVAVRVAGEVYGRARLQILAAPRSVDVTTSVAPDPRQDRHVLWAAAAAGLLPPCGRGPADGLRLCPEPAAADVSVDTPDGRAYDPLHCGDGWTLSDRGDVVVAGVEPGCVSRYDAARSFAALLHRPATSGCEAAAAFGLLVDESGCSDQVAATTAEAYAFAAAVVFGDPSRGEDLFAYGAPGVAGCSAAATCATSTVAPTRAQWAELLWWLLLRDGSVGDPVAISLRGEAVAGRFGAQADLRATGTEAGDVTVSWTVPEGATHGCDPLVVTLPATVSCDLDVPVGAPRPLTVTAATSTGRQVHASVIVEGAGTSARVLSAEVPAGVEDEPVFVLVEADQAVSWSVGAQTTGPWSSRVQLDLADVAVSAAGREATLVVVPFADRNGAAEVFVRACSNAGCAVEPVAVAFEAVNDAPRLLATTLSPDRAGVVTLRPVDADGDPVLMSLTGMPTGDVEIHRGGRWVEAAVGVSWADPRLRVTDQWEGQRVGLELSDGSTTTTVEVCLTPGWSVVSVLSSPCAAHGWLAAIR